MSNKISEAAAVLGRRGGKSRSGAKVAAARKNAQLGGRPRKSKVEIASMTDDEIMKRFREYTNGDRYVSIGIVEKKRVEKRQETIKGIGLCTSYDVIVTCAGKDYFVSNAGSWLVTERQLDSDCQLFAKRRSARISIGERVVLDMGGQATILDDEILWPR